MALAPERAEIGMRGPILFFALLGCSEFSLEDSDETVVNPLTVEESFLHNTEPSADILFVIDDTASMRTEHLMLQEALPTFVETLRDSSTSWHIGTITTDINSTNSSILRGDPWVLTNADSLSHIQTMIDVGTDGQQPEAGLASSLLALSPPLIHGVNRGFRRPNAALHIIIFSDGDDHSDESLDVNASTALLDFLADQSAQSGEHSRLSAIVGPSPNGCTSASGTALAGTRYIETAIESEGFVGSICNIDFVELSEWIDNISQNESPIYALQATPKAASVRVQVNEDRWDSGWDLITSPPAIQFTDPPPAGAEIQVRYEVQSS